MEEVWRALRTLQGRKRERVSERPTSQGVKSELLHFLHRVGISEEELNALNVVHVAGTKGKGSTCAFAESILRRHGLKTGMYSSPHLVSITERFRVNGEPLAPDVFISNFWHVYNALRGSTDGEKEAERKNQQQQREMPGFFKFLTILGYFTWLQEKVDVVILEVGIGGRLCSTNIFNKPRVCGISLIDFDHMEVLGKTLASIAREKAGIMKPDCVCFSLESQHEDVREVFQAVAEEKKAELVLLAVDKQVAELELGLKGGFQVTNATLAVNLVHSFLTQRDSNFPPLSQCLTQSKFQTGLRECEWPGRCQELNVSNSNITMYIDGAHNKVSMEVCVEWFLAALASSSNTRTLLFNCSHARDPVVLLEPLVAAQQSSSSSSSSSSCVERFSEVLFCPFDMDKPHNKPPPSCQELLRRFRPELLPTWEAFTASTNGDAKSVPTVSTQDMKGDDASPLLWQRTLTELWSVLSLKYHGVPLLPNQRLRVLPSVKHSMETLLTEQQEQTAVLATGSLYLVGNVLSFLQSTNQTN